MNTSKLKEKFPNLTFKRLVMTALGTFFVAFGTAVFILPFKLVTGGVSGISLVFSAVLSSLAGLAAPDSVIYNILTVVSSVDVQIAIVSWGLFFLGLFVLGRDFALKTLLSTAVYPVFVSLFLRLSQADIFSGYFNLSMSTLGSAAAIIAAVFGGVLVGLGCSITFLAGGSSGGVDILAFVICKAIPKLKTSTVLFIIDATIVTLGAFTTGNIAITLLGISTALTSSLIVDKVFIGSTSAFGAYIITENADEISRGVIDIMNRTTTKVNAFGGYSGAARDMLFVTFNMREYAMLLSIVKSVDAGAFVTIFKLHEINGEGWTR